MNQALNNRSPAVMLGGGQHARLIKGIAEKQDLIFIGWIDNSNESCFVESSHLTHFNDEFDHASLSSENVSLVAGIASQKLWAKRTSLLQNLASHYRMHPNIIDIRATVSDSLKFNQGIQVVGNSFIQSYVQVGMWSLVNTGSIIEHDSNIGDFVHIAPGVTVCGGVTIGKGTFVGAGSTIVEGVNIGENVLIGAGSLVLKDVPSGDIQYGSPSLSRRA